MTSRRKYLMLIVLLLLATTVAYLNHFNNDFHFDDSHSIVNNPYIRDINNIPSFFTDGNTSSILPQNKFYRPVVTASLAVDYWLAGGYKLPYFHVSTFIVFLFQGILMIMLFNVLLSKLTSDKRLNYVSLIAVAWYLLHPVNAETVNYIIARSDVQSTLFVVLGLLVFAQRGFWRKTHLYLIPVIVGVLAKLSALMFAPILFVYVLLFEEKLNFYQIFQKSSFRQLTNAVVKTLPAFTVCILMYFVVDAFTPDTWVPGGTSVFSYLITQPYVIMHYFFSFFAPLSLSADTDLKAFTSIWDIRFFFGIAFVTALIAAAFYASKHDKWRPVAFGVAWFLLALVPTSSVIPFAEVMNDHRMYFPFVGLTLSVCWSVYLIANKYLMGKSTRYILAAITAAALAVYGYGVHERNKVWKNAETLWQDVTIKSPKNARGHMNYAVAMMNKGEYSKAESHLSIAEKLRPTYGLIYSNLGVVKEVKGDFPKAEFYFKKGIQHAKKKADSYVLYGRFLFNRSRLVEAEKILRDAIRISSSYILPRELLMDLYIRTSNWEELSKLAQETLLIDASNERAAYVVSTLLPKQLDSQHNGSAPKP
jgi:protein O-mannosyl-transferase